MVRESFGLALKYRLSLMITCGVLKGLVCFRTLFADRAKWRVTTLIQNPKTPLWRALKQSNNIVLTFAVRIGGIRYVKSYLGLTNCYSSKNVALCQY